MELACPIADYLAPVRVASEPPCCDGLPWAVCLAAPAGLPCSALRTLLVVASRRIVCCLPCLHAGSTFVVVRVVSQIIAASPRLVRVVHRDDDGGKLGAALCSKFADRGLQWGLLPA